MSIRSVSGISAGVIAFGLALGAVASGTDRTSTRHSKFFVFQRWLDRDQFRLHAGAGERPEAGDIRSEISVPAQRRAGQPPLTASPNLNNPNLKPWAIAELKKYNDLVFAGQLGTTPRWSCLPGGVPGFSLFVVEPVYIVQSPKEVLLIYSGNREVRHVYMGVPHSANLKPSWYGESVGHYEGDTLVVDTIGLSPKAVIDNYHTPHTTALHVVERYHLIDNGRQLQTDLLVEDPGTFNRPWQAIQHYRKALNRPMLEENCSEANDNIFHLPGWVGAPEAGKPDF